MCFFFVRFFSLFSFDKEQKFVNRVQMRIILFLYLFFNLICIGFWTDHKSASSSFGWENRIFCVKCAKIHCCYVAKFNMRKKEGKLFVSNADKIKENETKDENEYCMCMWQIILIIIYVRCRRLEHNWYFKIVGQFWIL